MCQQCFREQGIDLDVYKMMVSVVDIVDLVDVLVFDSFNLLMFFYSIKIVQVMLCDYLIKLRSVVMDFFLLLVVNYDEESIINLMEVVQKLLIDCVVDEVCNVVYFNLE